MAPFPEIDDLIGPGAGSRGRIVGNGTLVPPLLFSAPPIDNNHALRPRGPRAACAAAHHAVATAAGLIAEPFHHPDPTMFRNHFLPVLALMCAASSAQVGGSTNIRTPTLRLSIAFFGGCTLDLSYRALAWADGLWRHDVKKTRVREYLNGDMKRHPTGSLTVSHTLTLGTSDVAPGSYQLYFEIDADMAYHLVLADADGKESKLKLEVTEAKEMAPRMALALVAGKEDDRAELTIAYGAMRVSLPVRAEPVAQPEPPKDPPQAPAGKDPGK